MSKLKAGVQQLRTIVIKLMRKHAAEGKYLGMASPDIVEGLANSLEDDPDQWFAAGMQLMQIGMIDGQMYEALQNHTAYSPHQVSADKPTQRRPHGQSCR